MDRDWRDASYLELAVALRNAFDDPGIQERLLDEFARREHECVTITLADYVSLQKASQLLEAVEFLVHERWIREQGSDDECYMLAISEILNRNRGR